ncbi:unnamed protein product [Blepharisma stoltei]|uniref:Uncharacterized protein n=1 Tax=Blepharisma stoltei TaxID=1481888 RepID=A0AAU9II55_9CILI|nr:unnamed protein product [Blepharisma stoltei]
MDWTAIKGLVEEMIDSKLSPLQETIHTQRTYLEELIKKLEPNGKDSKRTGSAGKPRLSINVGDISPPEKDKRPKTTRATTGRATSPVNEELKKEKEEEAKKKAELKAQKDLEIKKHQEEIKKKKQEELEKKKEQEEKKREAKEKAKEEENKKKEEAKKKKAEEEAKKKEEFKQKQAQEAEKKRKDMEEKNKLIEEKKKKKEEEKKKGGEEEKKEPKKKEEKKEEKKKVPGKKKEETKKIEEEKKVEEPAPVEEEKKVEEPVSEAIDEPSYKTLEEVQEAIKKLTSENPEPQEPAFELSEKSKESLKALNELEEEKFYLEITPPEDTIFVLRLFLQLLGQKIQENSGEAWAQCQDFLRDIKNKDLHEGKILSDVIEEKASSFDFSFENLDKVEEIARGNHAKLNPNYHASTCALAESLSFVVRDALVYGGIARGEGPSKLYSWLLHKQALLTAN